MLSSESWKILAGLYGTSSLVVELTRGRNGGGGGSGGSGGSGGGRQEGSGGLGKGREGVKSPGAAGAERMRNVHQWSVV